MRLKKIFDLITKVGPKLNKKEIYFIFPFFHLGGAETVHLDIMEIFKDQKTACIITNNSVNDLNKEAFKVVTNLTDISKIIQRKKDKKIALHLISKKINNNKNAVVFGCNSNFFYDLLPYLKNNIKVIDLIHAFSYEEPYASEKYSLNVVGRINYRVILGMKSYSDFENLYRLSNVEPELLERLEIIKNKVKIPEKYPSKTTNTKIKILFVGRDGYEKRPEIFFDIAKESLKMNLDCEFFVIGFKTDRDITENVTVVGEIQKSELDKYYLNSDLLLITSSREGFPMVVLESMAFGVVPICTDVGEIPSFITKENANGFLISGNADHEEIVTNFVSQIQLLNFNRQLLKNTSKNAYITVKNNFGGEIFAQKYKALFELNYKN